MLGKPKTDESLPNFSKYTRSEFAKYKKVNKNQINYIER